MVDGASNRAQFAARRCDEFAYRLNETMVSERHKGSDRNNVAYALLDASIEHFRGVVCLVGNGIYGSAFTLLRPQLEHFVRGAWLGHCATDEQIERFRTGDRFDFSALQTLIDELEALDTSSSRHLSAIKRNNYKVMCDLTHGGQLQAWLRIGDGEIGHRISHADAADVLPMAAAIAAAAAAVTFELGDRGSNERSKAVMVLLDSLVQDLNGMS